MDTPGGEQTIDDRLWALAHASPFGEKPDLGRMRQLLSLLGNPQIGLPVLHIGGTAGKGSTATFAAALLTAAGYRTGLHTKPHLSRVNERIIINGSPISDDDFRSLIEASADAARAVSPTWYEFTVALAMLHFRRMAVDIAVIEVGLGGRWDGTNVVQPLVAVLTNVGLDHTEVLGNTVDAIAREKVAIIKPDCLAITGVTQPSVRAIVEARARCVGVPLWRLGDEIVPTVRRTFQDGQTETGAIFDLRVGACARRDLHLGVIGAHQITNAALAIAAMDGLRSRGLAVPDAVVRRTLPNIRIPGRLEVVQRRPLILLDGAHNPDKMRALCDTIRHLFARRRLIVVAAFTRRHDAAAMLALLAPVTDHLVLTSFTTYADFGPGQALAPDALAAQWRALPSHSNWTIEPDPLAAVAAAQAMAQPDDCLCITGSLSLVGAVRDSLLRQGSHR